MVQRYKFESKSQQAGLASGRYEVVSNGSKVQIWKQITTVGTTMFRHQSCFQWFKGTNLKANHNGALRVSGSDFVVSNGSKVQIWKQITTCSIKNSETNELFPMVQRYKFESKSQLSLVRLKPIRCCFQWFKGTNLKANHNSFGGYYLVQFVVSNGSKVQIWKQITTDQWKMYEDAKLFPMVQRYKFESKSQLLKYVLLKALCCFQWFKGTNLKANHNYWKSDVNAPEVVSNGSKVQIWKQITTVRHTWPRCSCCFQWFKGTNLKANHNSITNS